MIDTQGDAYFAAFDRAADAVADRRRGPTQASRRRWPEGAAAPRSHWPAHRRTVPRCIGVLRPRRASSCANLRGRAWWSDPRLERDGRNRRRPREPAEFELRDLGQFRLKDITRPQQPLPATGARSRAGVRPPERSRRWKPPVIPMVASGHCSEPTSSIGHAVHASAGGRRRPQTITSNHRRIVQEVCRHPRRNQRIEAVGDNGDRGLRRTLETQLTCAWHRLESACSEHAWPSGIEWATAFAVHTGRLVVEGSSAAPRWFISSGSSMRREPVADTRLALDRSAARGRATRTASLCSTWASAESPRFDSPHRIFELVGDASN